MRALLAQAQLHWCCHCLASQTSCAIPFRLRQALLHPEEDRFRQLRRGLGGAARPKEQESEWNGMGVTCCQRSCA
eukprot:9211022-Alexandrium_andersonii.AAC.1